MHRRNQSFSLLLLFTAVVAANGFVNDPKQCGRQQTPVGPSSVVRGDNEAAAGSWPWHVSLLSTSTMLPSCGATLISNEWAVTAAHCIMNIMGFQTYYALMGVTRLLQRNGKPQLRAVTEVVLHPEFQRVALDNGRRVPRNDVALIRFNIPVNFTDMLQPICLPPGNEAITVNNQCSIAGFGTVDLRSKIPSKTLQESFLDVLDDNQCPIVPGDRYMFCAGDADSDNCQGDSGGGLFCNAPDDRFFLMGLVSWGTKCGSGPGYYTRLQNYIQWIQSAIVDPHTPARRYVIPEPIVSPTTIHGTIPLTGSDAAQNRPQPTAPPAAAVGNPPSQGNQIPQAPPPVNSGRQNAPWGSQQPPVNGKLITINPAQPAWSNPPPNGRLNPVASAQPAWSNPPQDPQSPPLSGRPSIVAPTQTVWRNPPQDSQSPPLNGRPSIVAPTQSGWRNPPQDSQSPPPNRRLNTVVPAQPGLTNSPQHSQSPPPNGRMNTVAPPQPTRSNLPQDFPSPPVNSRPSTAATAPQIQSNPPQGSQPPPLSGRLNPAAPTQPVWRNPPQDPQSPPLSGRPSIVAPTQPVWRNPPQDSQSPPLNSRRNTAAPSRLIRRNPPLGPQPPPAAPQPAWNVPFQQPAPVFTQRTIYPPARNVPYQNFQPAPQPLQGSFSPAPPGGGFPPQVYQSTPVHHYRLISQPTQ